MLVVYGVFAVLMLGIIFVRVLQANEEKKREALKDDPFEALAAQKRRSPEQVIRGSVYIVTGILAAVFLVFTVLTQLEYMPWHKKYMTDFLVLTFLFGGGPYGLFFNRDLKRIEALDAKFPELLRDIADSARAGMTLPKALVNAARGKYGALTDELRMMAHQVQWGVAFGDALQRFSDRTRTPLIERTVSLVQQAERAGGNVVDVLTAASADAREIHQILRERQEQMKVYNIVVYIAFFVFMVVVIVLTAQFIPPFAETVSQASGQQVGGLQFKPFDPEDFNTLFFHAAIIQSIGGGLVGGVFTRGHPVAGFVHIAAMMITAWFAFRVLVAVM
jgi:flagellar protein FlaJ